MDLSPGTLIVLLKFLVLVIIGLGIRSLIIAKKFLKGERSFDALIGIILNMGLDNQSIFYKNVDTANRYDNYAKADIFPKQLEQLGSLLKSALAQSVINSEMKIVNDPNLKGDMAELKLRLSGLQGLGNLQIYARNPNGGIRFKEDRSLDLESIRFFDINFIAKDGSENISPRSFEFREIYNYPAAREVFSSLKNLFIAEPKKNNARDLAVNLAK